MNHFPIVMINGPPGAGKSTLAFRLADAVGLPLLMRDQMKEVLFDTLGWKDRAWSMKLGAASYEMLFHQLECQLKARKSAIIESPFQPARHTERFLALKTTYGFEPVQIFCNAATEVLYERFHRRAISGERHPGHVDHLATKEAYLKTWAEGKVGILEIGGTVLEIDTTDSAWLDSENLQAVIRVVQAKLGSDHENIDSHSNARRA